jgi:hypothetical protein
MVLIAPDIDEIQWQEITWNAEENGRPVGSLKVRVLSGVGDGGLPQ